MNGRRAKLLRLVVAELRTGGYELERTDVREILDGKTKRIEFSGGTASLVRRVAEISGRPVQAIGQFLAHGGLEEAANAVQQSGPICRDFRLGRGWRA